MLAINGGKKTVPDGLRIESYPPINKSDLEMVSSSLQNTNTINGEQEDIYLWEKEWKEYCNSEYCLATNSGTAALHMAVAAAGVEPGDEVITTALSWTSSATCILHHGGIPVFADINPDTYNIDVTKIEALITNKTKAILPVHLYGQMSDMDPIMEIAKKYNLKVIEDACQAHGSTYKGRLAGTIGDIGCFSTQMSKLISGTEGGLLITNNNSLFEKAARIRQFGEKKTKDGTREYNAHGMGWMYRTSKLAAALCRSQFRNIDKYINTLNENCNYLNENLSGIKGLKLPTILPDCQSTWWDYKIKFCPEELNLDISHRDFTEKVSAAIEAEGVFLTRWEFVIPAMSLFQEKIGFGKGYPWSIQDSNFIDYNLKQYPEALAAIDCIRGIYCIKAPNGIELMEHYVKAIKKVFSNINQVLC